jgi:hypothetical protein
VHSVGYIIGKKKKEKKKEKKKKSNPQQIKLG